MPGVRGTHDKQLTFWVSPRQRRQLQAAADATGLSMSALIRASLAQLNLIDRSPDLVGHPAPRFPSRMPAPKDRHNG